MNRRSISKSLQTQTIFGRPLTIKSTVGGVLCTHNWQGHHQVIRIDGVRVEHPSVAKDLQVFQCAALTARKTRSTLVFDQGSTGYACIDTT